MVQVHSPPTDSLRNPQGMLIASGYLRGEEGERRVELLPGAPGLHWIVNGVRAAQDNFMRRYSDALAANYFLGGWTEKPDYQETDFRAYTDWIRYHSSTEPDSKTLEKYALIGGNKSFNAMEGLEKDLYWQLASQSAPFAASGQGVDLDLLSINLLERLKHENMIETITAACPEGLFVRTRPIADEVRNDKNMMIGEPSGDAMIFIPGCTYRLKRVRNFSGGEYSGSEEYSDQLGQRLLSYWRRFHSAILNDEVKVSLTLFPYNRAR